MLPPFSCVCGQTTGYSFGATAIFLCLRADNRLFVGCYRHFLVSSCRQPVIRWVLPPFSCVFGQTTGYSLGATAIFLCLRADNRLFVGCNRHFLVSSGRQPVIRWVLPPFSCVFGQTTGYSLGATAIFLCLRADNRLSVGCNRHFLVSSGRQPVFHVILCSPVSD